MKARALTPAARWLRRARDKLRISRKTLALAAGVSLGTLRNAEQSRHKISRQTAERLIREIAQRDAILARSAPPPLKAAALSQAEQTDAATFHGPPLAHLRLHPGGPRALFQIELDPRAGREDGWLDLADQVHCLGGFFLDELLRATWVHADGAGLRDPLFDDRLHDRPLQKRLGLVAGGLVMGWMVLSRPSEIV